MNVLPKLETLKMKVLLKVPNYQRQDKKQLSVNR